MRTATKKRAAQNRQYTKLRGPFLEAHPFCQSPWDCGNRSAEVHHKRGRRGADLLDQDHWVALCRDCHHRATVNPTEAIALGVSESRIGVRA